jgi:DNA-binding transcriptional MocR family regulator
MKIAFSHKLTFKAKIIYLYLAKYSYKSGSCFPSKATIAKECAVSLSSVTRALTELVAEGLEKTAHFSSDKGCTSNLYTLRFVAPDLGANKA